MKVALVNTYLHGGAGIACERLMLALNSIGVDAKLLTSSPNDKGNIQSLGSWKTALSKAAFYAERLSFLPYEKSKAVRFSYSLANFGVDIRQHPIIQDADVINIHWVNQGFLSLKSLEQLGRLGKPIIWTMHDMWPFSGGCHYAGNCLNYKKACGNCQFFLKNPKNNDLSNKIWKQKQTIYPKLRLAGATPSAWLRDCAKESSLFKKIEVRAIPNPIDINQYKPIDKIAARTHYKLPLDKKLALFMAMKVSDERKGFKYFEESLQYLHQQHQAEKSLELVVAGKANAEDFAHLPYKVHYIGQLSGADAIMQAYNASDMFVIPSLEDNLPNTIMESLACGTPVVAFQTGGIPEMVKHQKTGYIASYKNAQELADGIHWLTQHHEPLQVTCRQKVLNDYTFEIVAKKYQDLFQKMLNTP